MRDFIRLLTGRIAFERKALLLSAQLAYSTTNHEGYPPEYNAARIYHFLLTGEFPS